MPFFLVSNIFIIRATQLSHPEHRTCLQFVSSFTVVLRKCNFHRNETFVQHLTNIIVVRKEIFHQVNLVAIERIFLVPFKACCSIKIINICLFSLPFCFVVVTLVVSSFLSPLYFALSLYFFFEPVQHFRTFELKWQEGIRPDDKVVFALLTILT